MYTDAHGKVSAEWLEYLKGAHPNPTVESFATLLGVSKNVMERRFLDTWYLGDASAWLAGPERAGVPVRETYERFLYSAAGWVLRKLDANAQWPPDYMGHAPNMCALSPCPCQHRA